MTIPTNAEILTLLDQLERRTADDLESQWLEFKPWEGPKVSMGVAVEYAVCFGNAEGGVIVFGVADQTRGRARAIQGAAGYKIDTWQRSIFDSTRPNITASVEELPVPEGTGILLIVRITPQSHETAFGTVQGLYKKRVGKNCMPMDPRQFMSARVSSGAVDWSGEPAEGVTVAELDPLEVARARAILRGRNPGSGLLKSPDSDFLKGLGAIRGGHVTHTGLLLFGRPEVLVDRCPQNQLHYVHQTSETAVARNDQWQAGLLRMIEQVEQIFSGPVNPEEELSVGLFKLRIPAYPLDAIREIVLNALTHRDYGKPREVLLRHTPRQLVVTSPGGFVGGITPKNILRHEPVARNRTLSDAFVKLGLVEAAGTGRRRILIPALSYGKKLPQFESDGDSVTVRIFNMGYDRATATLVAKWSREGREIGLEGLMVLNHLREHPHIDAATAEELLQVDRDEARGLLDEMSLKATGFIERRGGTRAATYHLARGVAVELFGRAAYTRTRGLNPAYYAQMVKEYLADNPSISNKECRELVKFGDSPSAQVGMSRYLKSWSGVNGFLERFTLDGKYRYRLKQEA